MSFTCQSLSLGDKESLEGRTSWTLINALLLGFVIFQFTDAGHEPVVDGIGWRFAGVGILNAIFAQ
jgi:hypothetical protein